MVVRRAVCEVVSACVVWAMCSGRGSAPIPDVQQCIAHLCVVAGTDGIRCLRQLAIAHWAQTLPITATEGGRVLRPMIPAPAQEPRPFCVLCDSCHAALSDQPGSPQIRLGTPGRWLLPPPTCLEKLSPAVSEMAAKSVAWLRAVVACRCFQTRLAERGVRALTLGCLLLLCARRCCAERSTRLKNCRQVWLRSWPRLLRACVQW